MLKIHQQKKSTEGYQTPSLYFFPLCNMTFSTGSLLSEVSNSFHTIFLIEAFGKVRERFVTHSCLTIHYSRQKHDVIHLKPVPSTQSISHHLIDVILAECSFYSRGFYYEMSTHFELTRLVFEMCANGSDISIGAYFLTVWRYMSKPQRSFRVNTVPQVEPFCYNQCFCFSS